ncbi:MAG: rhodanese-like domain-containing protein [Bacteroidales bacterium]|nr:rhodanese-like domain-containing protein [Bacteroidales bacterium]
MLPDYYHNSTAWKASYERPRFQEFQLGFVRHIDSMQAKSLVFSGQAMLVDLRETEETMEGKPALPNGYLECPLSGFESAFNLVPNDLPVIFMCAHGIRSMRVAAWFQEQGRPDVFNLDGGFTCWEQD